MSNYFERGHSLTTKRTGRINAGLFTPAREAMIEWMGWTLDNDIPRNIQNQIAIFYPNMIERVEYIRSLSADLPDAEDLLEYLEGLCESCWTEMPGCECEVHFRNIRIK